MLLIQNMSCFLTFIMSDCETLGCILIFVYSNICLNYINIVNSQFFFFFLVLNLFIYCHVASFNFIFRICFLIPFQPPALAGYIFFQVMSFRCEMLSNLNYYEGLWYMCIYIHTNCMKAGCLQCQLNAYVPWISAQVIQTRV